MGFPSYEELMMATDWDGQFRSYLSTEAAFQILKGYQERNLIVPVVGDFAGPKALRGIGRYIRDHESVVSAFYVSNVEQYLFQDGRFDEFARNVATLPVDNRSSFIRSVWTRFGFTGTMEKLGVERRLLTAGENKGFLDPFSPQTEKQRAYAQTMLDQIHQQFIEVVKAGRKDKLKDTPDLFSGLVWNGQRGIEMGLADALGSLDFVAREVVKAEEIVDFTPHENIAERFAKRFGAATGQAIAKVLLQSGWTVR